MKRLLALLTLGLVWVTGPMVFGAEKKNEKVLKVPNGFEEVSVSPDERYAVMVPGRDMAFAPEAERGFNKTNNANYLVDRTTQSIIGKVDKAEYNKGGIFHDWLDIIWSDDSKNVIIAHYFRFWGISKVWVIEIGGNKIRQIEIGERIHKDLDKVIAKQAGNKDEKGSGAASASFCFEDENRLLIRVVSTTNPRQFSDQKTYAALLQGTFDMSKQKWLKEDVRAVKASDLEVLSWVYDYDLEVGKDESEEQLDKKLNDVYAALKIALSPKRFTDLKREQVAWLKQRDAKPTPEAKRKYIAERVEGLLDLLWD